MAAFFFEGLHHSVAHAEHTAAAAVLNLGIIAPALPVVALVFAAIVRAWGARIPTRPADLVHRLVGWGWRAEPAVLAARSAAIIAVLSSTALFLAASVLLGRAFVDSVARPENGVALLVGAQTVLFVGSAFVGGASYAAGRWVLVQASKLLGRLVGPAVLFALLSAVGVGAVVFVAVGTDVGEHLPWFLASGAVGGVAALLVAWMAAGTKRRSLAVAGAGLVAICVTAPLAANPPDSWRPDRAVFTGESPLTSPLYGFYASHLDFDGDGSIHLFGGGDCAPDDPEINPKAREIVANGIDENCSGSDLAEPLKLDEARTSVGKSAALKDKPHVFLITTDSLSMNRTSLGRDDRDTTPNLAKWAEEATVFDTAFALGPSTRLAIPGIAAGVFNSQVQMQSKGRQPYRWERTVPTLAAKLKRAGYRTVHITTNTYFSKKWRGYWVGFEDVDHSPYKTSKDKVHTAPAATDLALKFVRQASEDDRPMFLWVHYYDHHHPFKQPKGAPVYGKKKEDVFDAELTFADSHWKRLFQTLGRTFEPDEYIAVFTSDHGEAFDEFHPKKHHGYDLRTDVLHVPLVIQSPFGRGKRVPGLVTHADIAATVADLVGIPRERSWVGESLFPALKDNEPPKKNVAYGLFYIPERTPRGEDPFGQISVRMDEWYYEYDLEHEEERLTRWREDGAGRHDLKDSEPEMVDLLRHAAGEKLEELRAEEQGVDWRKKDAERRKAQTKKAPSSKQRAAAAIKKAGNAKKPADAKAAPVPAKVPAKSAASK